MRMSFTGSSETRLKTILTILMTGAACGAFVDVARAQTAKAEPSAQLEEIIVTAQKREQKLQDVPVAVTVVGANQLARRSITNASELQYAVPTLTYNAGPSTSYAIRGVGTTTYSRSSEAAVSTVVDGVIQGQPIPPTSGLFDVQRVEVLSGPQGMLFGKNASAGLINIVTNAPDPSARAFIAHADIGDHAYQAYRGVANLPLGETSALRVSAFSTGRDGMLDNKFNGKKIGAYTNVGARARLLWEASPDVKVNLIADYEKNHGGNMVWTAFDAGALTSVLKGCGVTPGPGNTDLCINAGSSQHIESYGLSAQVDWALGDYTLTSITADRQFSRYSNNDSDTLPANVLDLNESRDFSNQFSQELRIASPAGQRFEYVGGLYYYNYSYKAYTNQAGQLGIPVLAQLGVKADRDNLMHINQASYAVFGQGTLRLTDTVSLILGARETYDLLRTSNVFGVDPKSGINVPGFTNPLGRQPSARAGTDNFSYRVGAQYRPMPDLMLYVTYARGYKGPATNTGEAKGERVIKPEIPTNLEFGVKGSFFDRRLALDLTVYDQDVKDFQAQFVQTQNGLTSFVFGNASHLYVKGVEFNASARPIAGLRVDGGFIFNDATYGHFNVPCRAGSATICDVAGRQLSGAPKRKFTLSGEYERAVAADLDGFVQLSGVYKSRVNTASTPDPRLTVGAYTVVDARMGVRRQDGAWGVSLFAKNLFDKRFPALVFSDPLNATNYDQAYSQNAFRVIGLALDAKF